MQSSIISLFTKMRARKWLQFTNSHFLTGFVIGLAVTLLLRLEQQFVGSAYQTVRQGVVLKSLRYNVSQDVIGEKQEFDSQMHRAMEELSPAEEEHFGDSAHHHDNTALADQLTKKVRVLCWVMTSPKNLQSKAIHVKNTWAKRCNVLLFMSSTDDPSFPSIALNVSEGREHLTAKTMKAFKYVYDNHFNDADWFMKADDDTYVILENLRYFLSGEDSSKPVYFGHRFKVIVQQGYASGGGGYVLSKEALRRFGTTGYNSEHCAMDKGAEDVQMGKCLQNLKVSLEGSLDVMGRSRFHCLPPEPFLTGTYPNWLHKYDFEGLKQGVENVSDYAISFHYVKPKQMYLLEFLVYHLHPYGVINNIQDLNVKHNPTTS
ncbi:glycoprotein-N-acetylgalactosamine 3-beta-galactosyltransferase 1 [Aplysia californica]|uniref:N-acetylgalactosaminide beta-1,3-galactosyltransferase n=1 Tax=Aplysia californica TaxID=6500 RepID=A0ABM1VQY3_APLCA|nr:glycoprotein-N-acetylgalactosamine 3-beta-galactosyltransferase 1 [Aplysia californica]